MFLTLPALDASIPSTIEFDTHAPGTARMALAMHKAGLIRVGDLSSIATRDLTSAAVRQLVETGWLRAFCEEYRFNVLSAYCTIALPAGASDHPFYSDTGHTTPCCVVAINANAAECITIGPHILTLETLQPGLGRTALDILEDALSLFGVPYTLCGAFWMAQWLYWQGEENEAQVLVEYADQGENPDDIDIPRRSELFAGIPEWAYGCAGKDGPKKLTRKQFAKAAKRHKDHRLGAFLAAMVRLQVLNAKKSLLLPPPEEYECPEPPVLLYWENEGLLRVFDDHGNAMMEGEVAPYLRGIDVELTEAGITKALPLIRHTGLVLKTIDSALDELRTQ